MQQGILPCVLLARRRTLENKIAVICTGVCREAIDGLQDCNRLDDFDVLGLFGLSAIRTVFLGGGVWVVVERCIAHLES